MAALSADTDLISVLVAFAVTVAIIGVAIRWWRRRPASYPGDAIPLEKRYGRRRAQFGDGKARVEVGWRPCVEEQPHGDVLPRRVSGQQVWTFGGGQREDGECKDLRTQVSFNAVANPNAGDCIFREARLREWRGPRPQMENQPSTPLEAVRKGLSFYQMLQCDDGQWAGDYGGPHFLLPGFVIAAYVVGQLDEIFPTPHRRAIEAYLRNHQQLDGGWGTHLESPSTMFGSVLSYVTLRLVGVSAEDPAAVEGRRFLAAHGGALYAPSWAKFWLAVLGVYDYAGIAPVSPELWLLPSWFPIHPGKFWCHARMVYLPMSYLYGRRFAYDAAGDPLTRALRTELYQLPEGRSYADIDWSSHIHAVAEIDSYSPLHRTMRLVQGLLALYEYVGPWRWLRETSLRFTEEYMHSEDIETNYLTIGPVSKALHIVCSWIDAGGEEDASKAVASRPFRAHLARVPAYLWVAEDGMKVQGYNGSMAWDTSFAVQAVAEGAFADEFPTMCARAWGWLAKEQVRVLRDGDWRHWRQAICGGWGFSSAEQAWPVSDTTAEAFKAVLALRGNECVMKNCRPMPDNYLFDTVQFLLSYQNSDGGWATYENTRGYTWFELLNPSEVFGDIMIDYSYVECSSSAMVALARFSEQFPDHRRREILGALRRGACFIEAMQRSDGSWYGCWGNCFTYGCWFGVEGLVCTGQRSASCKAVRRCLQFLLSHQNNDGGWGEDFASCFDREYAANSSIYGCPSGSTVVQTAWALLALMAGDCSDTAAVQRGVELLMRRQLPSGDWQQENIAGVFNRSVGITYTAFRNVFPLWALGRFARCYGPRHGLV